MTDKLSNGQTGLVKKPSHGSNNARVGKQ